MTEPRSYTNITRRGETSGVGDILEIDGHLYRVVALDASTPVTDASMDLNAERGDMIVSYELDYVGPALAPAGVRALFIGGPRGGQSATGMRAPTIFVDDALGRYVRRGDSYWWKDDAPSPGQDEASAG